MSCPNCQQAMNTLSSDGQTVLHCSNCGGSFFEENGINRISLASAEKLAKDKKNDEIQGHEKLCPKDKTPLSSIQQSEAIPQNITLLQCLTCHGIFAFPDDLVNFKSAQMVKIAYNKIWNVPISALKSVLVLSFVAAISISLFANLFLRGQPTRINAEDVITKRYISVSGRFLFVSFSTKSPYKSSIVIQDTVTDSIYKKVVSDNLATYHSLTTTDLEPKSSMYYRIILTDESGNTIETERKKLF